MITPAVLQELTYLQGMGEFDLQQLAERCSEQHYARGTLILEEGAACPGLFFVIRGRVKVLKTSPEGREQILRIMGPGETFNDVPAFDGGVNPASVQAMEPAAVGLVPMAEIERLLEHHPQVARRMLRLFAGRLRVMVDLVSELSLYSVESRVARLLLLSSGNRALEQGGFRITQQDLAALVGTTREVAARALRSLEERGGIRRQDGGHIVVQDRNLLEVVSQGAAH